MVNECTELSRNILKDWREEGISKRLPMEKAVTWFGSVCDFQNSSGND